MTNDQTTTSTTRKEELQRELRELEAREAKAAEDKRRSTKPRYGFRIAPVVQQGSWERIRDDSVKMCRVTGHVINRDECIAAGWAERELGDGGMNYLFNTLSGKIVMRTGGGTVYIQDSSWSGNKAEAAQKLA